LGGDPGARRSGQYANPGSDGRRQSFFRDAVLAAHPAEEADAGRALADRRLRPCHAKVRSGMSGAGRVNLLPHREERRKRTRTHFAVLAGMTFALGLAVVGAGWAVLAQQIGDQEERLKIIKAEIAKLDKEIDEIREVKDKIAALLARKQ